MGQMIRIVDGARPWQPSPSALPGQVLDQYDVPRVGLLHEGGDSFIFACLMGEDGGVSVWAYAHVDDAEINALLTTTGPKDFDGLVEDLLRDRLVTLALARDDVIEHSTQFDAGRGGSRELLQRLAARLERLTRTADDVNRELAASC